MYNTTYSIPQSLKNKIEELDDKYGYNDYYCARVYDRIYRIEYDCGSWEEWYQLFGEWEEGETFYSNNAKGGF